MSERVLADPPRQGAVWPYAASAIVSLIGIADAVYLTIKHITGESLRCTVISGCSEVLSSPYSHIGSVPLAAVGAAAYFAVFSLSTLAAFGYGFAAPWLKVLAGLMFGVTLWLIYLQAAVIHHFCQYCLLSALVTTVLTALTIVVARPKTKR
jgi:uncharacterized membrane protein